MSRIIRGLRKLGLTNYETEDISTLASSSKKPSYDWYCSSPRCCEIERKFYSKKLKREVKVQAFQIKVLKIAGSVFNHDKCPDCGMMLFSKRARDVKD